MTQKKLMLNASALLIASVTFTSCEKNLNLPSSSQTETSPRAVFNGNSTQPLTWDNVPNQTYSIERAKTDFGPDLTGWEENLASINSETLRVKLLANKILDDGGMIANLPLSIDASSCILKFRLKFNANFQWGRGGKVGFGLRIGKGYTGGNDYDARVKGDGASVRLMWVKNPETGDRPKLRPYLYFKDMEAGSSGDELGLFYPKSSTSGLAIDTWYDVEIRVKSNTGSTRNGLLYISIRNSSTNVTEVVVNRNDFRYTSVEGSNSLINTLSFHTFRGGSNIDDWKTSSDGSIAYDNVQLTLNPNL